MFFELQRHLALANKTPRCNQRRRLRLHGQYRPLQTERTAATRATRVVVQRRGQKLHRAAAIGQVFLHLLPLQFALPGKVFNALVVHGERIRCSKPLAVNAHDRRLRLHHQQLEHFLNLRRAQVHGALQVAHAHAVISFFERTQNQVHLALWWKGRITEEFVDTALFFSRQQHTVRQRYGTARAPHLLVIGNNIARRLVVNHEGEVRLVIPHAQGGGGYKALQLVRQQGLLQAFAFNIVNVRVIGIGVSAVLPQPSRHALGISGGEYVHNAAAWQRRDVLSQPSQAVGRTGHLHHLQGQTVAHQRAALHLDVVTQLRAHIALHPVVRCGGGGQHRNVVG